MNGKRSKITNLDRARKRASKFPKGRGFIDTPAPAPKRDLFGLGVLLCIMSGCLAVFLIIGALRLMPPTWWVTG